MNKEYEMFPLVKELLLKELYCDEVFGEVGTFDVVGFKGKYSIVVEMKKTLSLKVIEQAVNARKYSDYVFVAVPKPKKQYSLFTTQLLKEKGIGLIFVEEKELYFQQKLVEKRNDSLIKFWGRRNKNKHGDLRKNIKYDFHSLTVGGVKSGDGITEYSLMIENIKNVLRYQNWISIDELLNNVETYYKNPKTSLIATLKAEWNKDIFEMKKEERVTYCRLKK